MRPHALIALALVLAPNALVSAADQKLPNILWLTTEDMGPELGCYGDPNAVTPNLDRLASRGVRYARCWSNAPVCAPARSTIILGVYPTSTGGEHMRSEVRLPEFIRAYPTLLKEAGYHCTNQTKTDYNYAGLNGIWEGGGLAPWKARREGQPFFAIFNHTGTHESQIRTRPHQWVHDPAKMRVPAYHPDTLEVRQDWAQYYDNITEMDARMGEILDRMEAAGVADDTIIFFYGDHGSGMPRSKRWPYNSGLQVALIVYVPPKWQHLAPAGYKPGGVIDRLVSFVDLAPTLLSIAGRKAPDWMQGSAFMGQHVGPAPRYLFGFRGRMDERIDCMRSVTDGRYVYVRNFKPDVIYGQHIAYMFVTPTTQVWKKAFDEGRANAAQSTFWKPKAIEELYDLQTDRDEVNNLAGDPKHAAKLAELRQALREHQERTIDVGILPEAEMHRRAGSGTIYEMARDPKRFDVKAVLDRAWTPDNRSPAELRSALSDESPSERIEAARLLALHGEPGDLPAALAVLKQHASPRDNNVYVAVQALNAIDQLGDKARPLHDYLRAMPVKEAMSPDRAQSNYVGNLLEHILGSGYKPPVDPDAKAKKKQRAGKKKAN